LLICESFKWVKKSIVGCLKKYAARVCNVKHVISKLLEINRLMSHSFRSFGS
jgi:hypothetical protein